MTPALNRMIGMIQSTGIASDDSQIRGGIKFLVVILFLIALWRWIVEVNRLFSGRQQRQYSEAKNKKQE